MKKIVKTENKINYNDLKTMLTSLVMERICPVDQDNGFKFGCVINTIKDEDDEDVDIMTISVIEEDEISLDINLNELYHTYFHTTLDDVVWCFLRVVSDYMIIGYCIHDYDKVKKYIKPVMYSMDYVKNKFDHYDLSLDKIVYREYLDFIILYEFFTDDHYECTEELLPTNLVTSDMLDVWGVSKEELDNYACDNHNGYELELLDDYCAGMYGEYSENLSSFTKILTNANGVKGAVGISDMKMLNNLFDVVGEEFYMIPSSIHEVLILPTDKCKDPEIAGIGYDEDDESDLLEYLSDINDEYVYYDEILSYNIYKFMRDDKIDKVGVISRKRTKDDAIERELYVLEEGRTNYYG